MKAEFEATCSVKKRCTKAVNCPVAKGEEKGTEYGRDLDGLNMRLNASRLAIADHATSLAGPDGPELIKKAKHGQTKFEYPGTCGEFVEMKVQINGIIS